jgi:hypothetical protein
MAKERKSEEQKRKALDNQKQADKLRKKRTVTMPPKKRRSLASKADAEQDKARRRNRLADKFETRGE